MSRALVTGATGFIGARLVRALLARGDEVTALVRASSDRSQLEPLGVRFAVGDVTDADSLRAPAAGADVVFHLAAMLKQPWDPGFLTTNADGVGHVADACAAAEVPPVLVAVSSIAAAGPARQSRPLREDDPPHPVSQYGDAKLRGERAAIERAGRVPVTIVRPPIVFGEGDRTALPMFKAVARGVHPVPSGDPTTSMIHVDDLAAALAAAAERGERVPADATPGAGIYYAAAEEIPAFSEVGRMIAAGLERSVRMVPAPAAFTHVLGAAVEAVARLRGKAGILSRDKAREATAGSWACTAAKARRDLDFTPARPLAERLHQTARWYREQGWL